MNEGLKNTTDNNFEDTLANMTDLFMEAEDELSDDDVISKDDIDAMFARW